MADVLLSAFYFGTVEHYALIAKSTLVTIDTGEHYERQSYRTRTGIIGPNGKQDLIVTIDRRSGEKMPMHTVELSYTEPWNARHVQAIRSAYGQTPWFIHYIDEIETVLLKKYDRLMDLDLATMRLAMRWLGLKTEVVVSPTYVEEFASSEGVLLEDHRTDFNPKRSLPKAIPEIGPYTQVFADRHGFTGRMSIIDL
ncbi:MAG: WbqC family protein, partial [Flavobacteriales bacterium]